LPPEAVTETSRCIKCEDVPCAKASPAEINVSKFIRQVSSRNYAGVIKVIKKNNILDGTYARIYWRSLFCK